MSRILGNAACIEPNVLPLFICQLFNYQCTQIVSALDKVTRSQVVREATMGEAPLPVSTVRLGPVFRSLCLPPKGVEVVRRYTRALRLLDGGQNE